MSNSIFVLVVAAIVGAALGALYLGLLWTSVRLLARRRAAAFGALAMARTALVLSALGVALSFGVGAGQILAALTGFVAVRVTVIRNIHTVEGRHTWK